MEVASADNGHGVYSEIQQRIFQPFFTTLPREQGSGFGLAVVARVIAEAGGYLYVNRLPRQGMVYQM